MKKILCTLLCIFMLTTLVLPVYAATDVPDAVMNASRSVVRILSESYSSSATGSGFVIQNKPGEVLIVTNNHVVDGDPYSISVWIGEQDMVNAEVVFKTAEKDLCLLKVEDKMAIPALPLAQTDAQQGEAVFAVGFPGVADIFSDVDAHTADEATITDGIISAVRTLTIEDDGAPVKLLQINAAINAGNSGGPLFNAQGQVIGVNTYGINNAQGVFGAIDISELQILLEENKIVLEPVVTEVQNSSAEEELVPEQKKSFPVISVVCGVLAALLLVGALLTGRGGKKIKAMSLQEFLTVYPQGLGVSKAVALLMPVVLALRDNHNNGKLHLQICPEKIQVTPDGVHLVDPTGQESDRFNTGYAAPEIYKGSGCGISSDIYSYAALLYRTATGKVPENSLHPEQVAEAIAVLASTEPEFAAILKQCMAPEAQDRPQSVQDVIYQISSFNIQSFQIPQETWNKSGVKKNGKTGIRIAAVAAAACLIAVAVFLPGVIEKRDTYDNAAALMEAGQYSRAIAEFEKLGEYKDSVENIQLAQKELDYESALALLDAEEFEAAQSAFAALGDFRDCASYLDRFQTKNVILTKNYVYDGLKECEIRFEYKNGRISKETCEFTADSNVSFYGYSVGASSIPFGETTAACTAVYTYPADTNGKKINVFNSKKTLLETRFYEYDDEGRILRESHDYKNNSQYNKDLTYTYKYDNKGNKIERLWFQNMTGAGNPYHWYKYEYDSHNEIISQSYKYNWSFKSSDSSGVYEYENEYDENGRIIKHIALKGTSYSYEYEYDADGNMIRKVEIQNGKKGGYKSGKVVTEYEYEYDELGNVIRQINRYTESGKVREITFHFGDVLVFE